MGDIGNLFNTIFAFPIYNVLMLLDHLFGDFGLSIIVLTLLTRLVLFPLTLKQMRSTKATQALQPMMAELKKQYANDRSAQQAAMTDLYKRYNINPAAGCLPLLIQMPVLYGLYGAMHLALTGKGTVEAINQYLYPFVPHFVVRPDFDLRWFTFLHASWFLSLASPDVTHILPILAGLATFIQLRMSQARAPRISAQKDMMTQQMQIMSFVMPFFTIFIAWNLSAGLALYWITSSLLGMVQQYFVTGWGALFTTPALGGVDEGQVGDNRDTSMDDARKEENPLNIVVDSDAEFMHEQNMRGKGYSRARRRRPNSASTRRLGNTTGRNLLHS